MVMMINSNIITRSYEENGDGIRVGSHELCGKSDQKINTRKIVVTENSNIFSPTTTPGKRVGRAWRPVGWYCHEVQNGGLSFRSYGLAS